MATETSRSIRSVYNSLMSGNGFEIEFYFKFKVFINKQELRGWQLVEQLEQQHVEQLQSLER